MEVKNAVSLAGGILAIQLYAEQKDGSIMRRFLAIGSDPVPVRGHQFVGCSDQEGKHHINRRKYALGEIVEKDAMQPALNESAFRLCAMERVFHPCKCTDHAEQGLSHHEQDCGKMCNPEAGIWHEPGSPPCADPNQWQTANDK